jgi:hypothetical protein
MEGFNYLLIIRLRTMHNAATEGDTATATGLRDIAVANLKLDQAAKPQTPPGEGDILAWIPRRGIQWAGFHDPEEVYALWDKKAFGWTKPFTITKVQLRLFVC